MIKTFDYNNQVIKFEVTNPEDHLQKYWLGGRFYEEGMLKFIYDRWAVQEKQVPVVVDVGACIGNHTIFFARLMFAYVYAFEPVPENMALIKRNAELNGVKSQITFVPHAAGSRRGKVKFEKDATGNCGMGRISSVGSDTVGLITVDEVISHSHEVDILKIDVEGYNLPVLGGAYYTIKHNKPDIYIECQTPEELQEVKNFLLPMFYKVHPTPFNRTPTYLFYYEKL